MSDEKKPTLHKVSDEAFRFIAGLNLQDHPVVEQRQKLEVVRKLKEALAPGGNSQLVPPSPPADLTVLNEAAKLFNEIVIEKLGLTEWSVVVRKEGVLELVYRKQARGLSWEQIQELSQQPKPLSREQYALLRAQAEAAKADYSWQCHRCGKKTEASTHYCY